MESQTAKVIPWSGKAGHGGAEERSVASRGNDMPSFAPIDGLIIVLTDEQLDALATTFRLSPVRRAMTFEAYLAVRGFGRPAD